ncbi:MAG: hypothetical protein ACRED1_09435, partial [Limisphaerales bacterium]
TNVHGQFSLSCLAPNTNAAETIVAQLHDYFGSIVVESLVPPWQPKDSRSPAETDSNNRARATWIKLQDFESDIEDDTNLDSLESQLETDRGYGGSNVGLLQSEIADVKEKLYRQNLPQLIDVGEGNLDTNVVALFCALNIGQAVTNPVSNQAIRKEIAQRLGRLADNDSDCFCAQSGYAFRSGQTIRVSFVSFNRADEGPLALVSWLHDQQCDDFKYNFMPVLVAPDPDQ